MLENDYIFRNIRSDEAVYACEIENICFPPNEACLKEHICDRVEKANELFLVTQKVSEDKIAGFINGVSTYDEKFDDKFFKDIKNHKKDGHNVMILGLDILPKHRGKGLARLLMKEYIRRMKIYGKTKLILTCHDTLIDMYKKMGFKYMGVSASKLGNQVWYEMEYDLRT